MTTTTAMVWGANGGLGRALTEHLIDRGWTVISISRDEDTLRDVATYSLAADLVNPASVQRAVQAAAYEVNDVNLWVYAAGDIMMAPVEEMAPAAWQRIVSANLGGVYLASHYSLPLLAPDAHLVVVGAISERLRLPGLSAYAAAKAGVEAFTDALRKEQRQRRVTLVRPAAIATPLWDKVPLRMPKNALQPSEVAARILSAYHEGHSGTLELSA